MLKKIIIIICMLFILLNINFIDFVNATETWIGAHEFTGTKDPVYGSNNKCCFAWEYNTSSNLIINYFGFDSAKAMYTGYIKLSINGNDYDIATRNDANNYGWVQFPYHYYWDNIDLTVNGYILFEVNNIASASGSGQMGLDGNDLDEDGDTIFYYQYNYGNDLRTGVLNTSWYSAEYEPVYSFMYTDLSAGTQNVYTIGSGVSYNTVNLSGYYYNDSNVDNVMVGFNVSKNSDMSDNTSYYVGNYSETTNFYQYITNLDGYTTYYYNAYGYNVNDAVYYEGTILNFTTDKMLDVNTYLRVYDLQTGNRLAWYHPDYDGTISGTNYLYGYIFINDGQWWLDKYYFTSAEDIIITGGDWLNGYSENITITGVFTNEPSGKVNGLSVVWSWYNTAFTMYYGNTYDIFLSRVYDINETEEINYYDNLLGANYCVFLNYELDCFYGAGSHPKIVYNLTDDYVTSSVEGYKWVIRKIGSNERLLEGAIDLTGVDYKSDVLDINYWSFPSSGEYWIGLYNLTDSYDTFYYIFYNSPSMKVCGTGSESGTGTSVIVFENFRGSVYGAILGLILTLFCLLIPFIIAKGINRDVSIPPIVFAISGGLGVVVSTVLPLFDVWVVAFIVIIGIIVLVAQYVIKSSGSGGE